ncbi:MAG: hypothetical protein ACK5NF_02675, partial [Bacilli bacterium]
INSPYKLKILNESEEEKIKIIDDYLSSNDKNPSISESEIQKLLKKKNSKIVGAIIDTKGEMLFTKLDSYTSIKSVIGDECLKQLNLDEKIEFISNIVEIITVEQHEIDIIKELK